jgi:hypothetical protein
MFNNRGITKCMEFPIELYRELDQYQLINMNDLEPNNISAKYMGIIILLKDTIVNYIFAYIIANLSLPKRILMNVQQELELEITKILVSAYISIEKEEDSYDIILDIIECAFKVAEQYSKTIRYGARFKRLGKKLCKGILNVVNYAEKYEIGWEALKCEK